MPPSAPSTAKLKGVGADAIQYTAEAEGLHRVLGRQRTQHPPQRPVLGAYARAHLHRGPLARADSQLQVQAAAFSGRGLADRDEPSAILTHEHAHGLTDQKA